MSSPVSFLKQLPKNPWMQVIPYLSLQEVAKTLSLLSRVFFGTFTKNNLKKLIKATSINRDLRSLLGQIDIQQVVFQPCFLSQMTGTDQCFGMLCQDHTNKGRENTVILHSRTTSSTFAYDAPLCSLGVSNLLVVCGQITKAENYITIEKREEYTSLSTLKKISLSKDSVSATHFRSDSEVFFGLSSGNVIQVDINKTKIPQWQVHNDRIVALTSHGNTLVIASFSQVSVLDIKSAPILLGEFRPKFYRDFREGITAMALTDNQRIVCGNRKGDVFYLSPKDKWETRAMISQHPPVTISNRVYHVYKKAQSITALLLFNGYLGFVRNCVKCDNHSITISQHLEIWNLYSLTLRAKFPLPIPTFSCDFYYDRPDWETTSSLHFFNNFLYILTAIKEGETYKSWLFALPSSSLT